MKKGLMFVLSLSVAAFVVTLPTFAGTTRAPERATMLMLGVGIGAVALVRRFTKKS